MPRYVDADALLKHEIEADRMGAMLVVGKGYILSAPEIDVAPVVRGYSYEDDKTYSGPGTSNYICLNFEIFQEFKEPLNKSNEPVRI